MWIIRWRHIRPSIPIWVHFWLNYSQVSNFSSVLLDSIMTSVPRPYFNYDFVHVEYFWTFVLELELLSNFKFFNVLSYSDIMLSLTSRWTSFSWARIVRFSFFSLLLSNNALWKCKFFNFFSWCPREKLVDYSTSHLS